MADDFKANEVGGRYAQAVFELALEGKALDAVRADLQGLKALYQDSPELRRLLTSPTFTADDKAQGLKAVTDKAGIDPLTAKALGLLARNGRLGSLPAVVAAFEALHAAHAGVVAAQVTSAAPLTKSQAEALKTALTTALGKSPEIETRVDPSILGGLKVKVGSRLFDASLKTRLDQMKFALKRA